ncbi:hemerythrin domain-containing protein [Sphingomonas sp. AX6]|uniref:hemerythrin domain-containing protein n=1 Tax=Sphingomonas sp. AX6 TaxID=2653171 RepID=UPI0012F0B0C4|nr:hemerythrin domain-containing protein [Sphingomonas sp. AX6]VXC82405.1 conserved hypothetical protein [Sphingomonas sp. AX6]
MYSFERLIREHAEITTLARTLTRAIEAGESANARYVALKALAHDLADHLAREDADLYPALMLSVDEGAASAARDAVEKFETLATDWGDYTTRWTRDDIAADGPGFAAASAEILGRLAARVKVENDLLYPLALRAAQITLREEQIAA